MFVQPAYMDSTQLISRRAVGSIEVTLAEQGSTDEHPSEVAEETKPRFVGRRPGWSGASFRAVDVIPWQDLSPDASGRG